MNEPLKGLRGLFARDPTLGVAAAISHLTHCIFPFGGVQFTVAIAVKALDDALPHVAALLVVARSAAAVTGPGKLGNFLGGQHAFQGLA